MLSLESVTYALKNTAGWGPQNECSIARHSAHRMRQSITVLVAFFSILK